MVGIRVNEDGAGDRKRAVEEFWGRVGPAIALAVDASFHEASMRNPTHSEIKQRVLKCKKIVEVLRNDLKWSLQRIEARLPAILRKELSGVKGDYEEGKRERSDKAGNSTVIYTVDAASKVTAPVTTVGEEKALEVEFKGEEDMAGDDDDIVAQETADPDDVMPEGS